MIIKEDKRFNEKVYILKLKNGMQVHMLPKETPYFSTYVELSMPYGSNHLDYAIDGTNYQLPAGSAHFMEHKIFAMPYGDAFIEFSNLGVDANAMTSYQQTSYLFNATSHVEDALKLLLDMLDTPYFTDENIIAEEKIIAEELKMYLDDIENVIYQDLMSAMYKNHPFKEDIGGTLDSIKEVDKDVLNRIHRHFYHPSNRLIVISGHIDIKQMKAFFKAYDQSVKEILPKIKYAYEPKTVVTKETIKIKDVSISKMVLGYKLPLSYRTGLEQIKQEMIYGLLFNLILGPSSILYHRLLSEHKINKNFYMSQTFEGHFGHFVVFADSKDPIELKDYLIKQFEEVKEDSLTKEAFERYLKVYIGQFVFALNQNDHKAYMYGKYIHKGTHLFDVIDTIASIKFEDILKAYDVFIHASFAYVIYKKD